LLRYGIIVILGLLGTAVSAQRNSRDTVFTVPADSMRLDTLSIAPHSFFLFDASQKLIDRDQYSLDAGKGVLFAPKLSGQKVRAMYRAFPENYSASYAKRQYATFQFDTVLQSSPLAMPSGPNSLADQDQSGVNTTGSISRGISAGNNQDVIMNSSMNLQMEGYLTNTIQIAASISDQNIPIQPEGNSQQISEFDQVYITLFTEDHSATFGDFETANRNGSFLLYNKKGLGAQGHTNFRLKEERSVETDVSVAISKGKFCSQDIETSEGNQGPYRLYGCNNEAYIVVLSGSEQVYVNGKRVKRGESNDYVIDYNAGEITFTSRRLITKNSRVSIDFEYSEQNYARFFVSENMTVTTKRSKTWINVFSEQDNKNQPFQQDSLSRIESALYRSGDGTVFIENVIEDTTWDASKIYYLLKDTVLSDGRIFDSIYEQTYDQAQGKYVLGFSYVGANNGHYVRVQSSANGKVYAWTEPYSDGTPSGDYMPVSIVVAPEKKQVVAVGSVIQLFRNTELQIESAVSNFDKNTASPYGNEDNTGGAGYAKLTQYIPVTDSSKCALYGSYQLVGENFNGIATFRPVEFSRDWAIAEDAESDEHLATVGVKYIAPSIFADISHSSFIQDQLYKGRKEDATAKVAPGGFKAVASGSVLNAESDATTTAFDRASADISQKIAFARIGATGEFEKLNKRDSLDYLTYDAQRYYQYGTYTQSADSNGTTFKLEHIRRKDFSPSESYETLLHSTSSQDYSADIGLHSNPLHTFSFGTTYRILHIADTAWGTRNGIAPERNLSIRAEHTVALWKRAISNRLFLETGSGLELKRDYSYIEVSPGQGSYQWIDYNGNGTAELNEFEIAQYQQQANYMRVFLSSNEYVRVYTNQFNHSFSIDPYNNWRSKTGFKKIASRLSMRTAYNFSRKIDRTDFWANVVPAHYFIGNVLVHSLQSSFRSSFHINKPNHTLSGIYNYAYSDNKFLSSNGTESRNSKENSGIVRWNISDVFTAYGSGSYALEKADMEAVFLENKEYNITSYSSSPKLEVQPGPSFVFSGEYVYTQKQNKSTDMEKALVNECTAEARYSHQTRGRLTSKISAVFINFSGENNTSLAYTMLDGLSDGKNYLWELQYSKNISEFLNLSLSYNGQKSDDAKVIHIGTVQLKAFF